MLRFISNKRAQTTLEYAILIGVIVGGLIAMQTVIKRGWQGKLKESADQMGEAYSPGYTTGNEHKISNSASTEATAGGTTRTDITMQKTETTGQEKVEKYDQEYWWKRSE